MSISDKLKVAWASGKYANRKPRDDIKGNKYALGSRPNRTSFSKGSAPWNKGKKYSKEFVLERGIGLNPNSRNGFGKHNNRNHEKIVKTKNERNSWYSPKGISVPEETKKKISATLQNISINDWKGFSRSDNARARDSPAYHQWRKSVFERDDYKCKLCSKRGGELEAHHKESFAKNKELRFDINNGMTVCVPCHTVIDKYRSIGGQ